LTPLCAGRLIVSTRLDYPSSLLRGARCSGAKRSPSTRLLRPPAAQLQNPARAGGPLQGVYVSYSRKSTTLAAIREIWESEGYTVKGAALAGIAVDNLEVAAGIKSRTLASYELAWSRGRDPLTRRDILVIDEAGMIGTRQLEHVLRVAEKAHTKVVLVGDAEQLQAIEAGAAFRGLAATHGVSNLTANTLHRNALPRPTQRTRPRLSGARSHDRHRADDCAHHPWTGAPTTPNAKPRASPIHPSTMSTPDNNSPPNAGPLANKTQRQGRAPTKTGRSNQRTNPITKSTGGLNSVARDRRMIWIYK
jgi:hypothetical protein